MKHLLTGCPVCGAKLYLDSLNQYVIRRNIKKNGEISKTSRKIDYGTIDASLFYCSDSGCDFSTDNFLSSEIFYKLPSYYKRFTWT